MKKDIISYYRSTDRSTGRAPFRYYMEAKPITIWESISRFWQTLKWQRNEIYMRPVKAGEPGYDEAPFEESIIWDRTK